MIETEVIDSELLPTQERRRKLLPIWIKIFLWIFMIFGFIAPVGLILGLLGIDFNVSIYGLETITPLSFLGLSITLLFALKGTVSLGLWMEKKWAVKLATLDAIIGISVCILVMFILPFLVKNSGFGFTLRLELIALIPYLIKMKKIKAEWENRE